MSGTVTCLHDLASRSFGMCMMLLSILEMAVEYNITSSDVIVVCKKKKKKEEAAIA